MKFAKHDLLIWFLFLIMVIVWYYPSLYVYFAQDDFWLIRISRVDWNKLWTFLIPASDAVWYRPLSSQVFFFLGQKLFGLLPLPFHTVVIITHSFSMLFLYRLMRYLKYSFWVGLTTTVIYGLHQIHTVSMSWLATYSIILGSLLLILSLHLIVKRKHGWALLIFTLAALTHEVLLLIPVLWIYYIFDHSNNRRRLKWQTLLPYWLLIGVILWFRLVRFPTSVETPLYQFSASGEVFSTLKFYVLRFLGVPLAFDQLPSYLKVVTVFLVFDWVLITSWGVRKQLLSITNENSKEVIFVAILVVMLVPFLLLSQHLSPHYLSFALVGGAPLVAWGFEGARKTHLVGFVVGVTAFVLLQFMGSRWTYQSHWIFQRAKLAETLVKEGRFDHPVGSEEYFALGAGAAKDMLTR